MHSAYDKFYSLALLFGMSW